MTVPANVRRQVVQRAQNRCEYCGLSQSGQEALFHLDQIIPSSDCGPTTIENLALAYVSCSLRKGARQTAFDPETGEEVTLFHPRLASWPRHFHWLGVRIVGFTPTGRSTVAALSMNRPLALAIRREEAVRGRHPQ
jgi:hypothetical protein